MSFRKPLSFCGSKSSKELLTLFSSGSTYSCLPPEIAWQLGSLEKLPTPLQLETNFQQRFIRIENRVTLDFYLNNLRLTDEFIVVPGLSEEAMIGATTMQKWRITLDFEHNEIITNPRANRLILM